MDEIFKDLQKAGQNEMETLVKWMRDAKLVEATKEGEEKARALFNDVKDKNKVELEKFQEIVKKLAEDSKKPLEELSKKLAEEGPKIQSALQAGVKAFTETLAGGSQK